MKRFAAVLLVLAGCATRPPAPAVAIDPELKAEISRIEQLVKKQPSSTHYLYALALYYDRAKDTRNVIRWLRKLDALAWRLGVGNDFPNASADPEFQRVAERLDARAVPVRRGVTAFTIPKERRIRSEGITYDPIDDVFYLSGGKAALLRVDRAGAITEVAIDPVGEKFGRLGLDVDAGRRQIWAVSAAFDPSAPENERGRSGISVYDLRDGRLLRRVMIGSATEPSFLNDMTLLRDGTAFVTDTTRHQVFRLLPGATEFEVWASGFEEPNGITVSTDEKTLYVADFRGIEALDLATRARRLLTTDTLLHGIDGLVEYRGSLIGIHNVLGWPRVVRVYPSDNDRVEILEAKNPLLDTPSTGVVVDDEYYFIPNRHRREEDTVMMKIALSSTSETIQRTR
jgi:hypothetical protein